jgi:hypothetical protein
MSALNKKIFALLTLCSLVLLMFGSLMVFSVRADISEAKVVSYSWYIAPSNTIAYSSGDLIVVGEVQNIGSSNLGYIAVVGAAYNDSGSFLASAEAHSSAIDIVPGGKVPFYMDFTVDNGLTGDLSWVPSVTNVTVAIEFAPDTTDSLYGGLTITQVATSQNNGMTVTGVIQNTGTQTTGETWIVGTFYNSSGTVVSLGISPLLAETLVPGGSVPFTVNPIEDTGSLSQISNYSLVIQTAQPISTPTPTAVASSTSSPIPTYTVTSSPSPSQSSLLNYTTTLTIVALVAVAVAIIVVVLLLRERHKTTKNNPIQPALEQSL